MRALPLAVCALLCGALLCSSCERQPHAATQLLVAISAEPVLASRLKRVSAVVLRTGAKARTGKEPKYEFNFVDDADGGAHVNLPFSFGVSKGASNSVSLIIEGFDSAYAKAPAVIEHKLVASFEPGVTRQLSVLLRDACFNNVCEPLTETCAAGSCVDIKTGSGMMASSSVIDAGDDAAVMDAAVIVEAGADSHVADAHSEPAPSRDSGSRPPPADDADGGEPMSACAQPDVCPPDYPCTLGKSGGYTCLGQFADWPMPSSVAGAKFAPSYDYASKAGVVIDRVTQLQWQRDVPKNYPGCSGKVKEQGDTCTWEEAENYCHQLDLDGGGWRLPSKIELESLLTHASPAFAFAPEAFPGVTTDHIFWTRSSDSFLEGWAWVVFGSFGGMSIGSDRMSPSHVRCMRGGTIGEGTPQDRYTHDASAGTVADTRTQLVWQRDFGDAKTFESAQAYCASRGAGWRVPGLTELLTLVDPTRSNPALDTNNFPAVAEDGFWTASQTAFFENEPPQHMIVEFFDGTTIGEMFLREGTPDFTVRVRCVR